MKALVTGAGGFLGSALVKALLQRGATVTTIQRGHYPALQQLGATIIQANLADPGSIANISHCDVVFHVAAKTGVWGDYDDYYQANVIATKNIITACNNNNIRHLVYTSTPSVVFDGIDEDYIDESTPYSKKFFNAYQKTKALAEQLVLTANSPQLKTVALRPHLIWGPNDPHLIARIIHRAKAGKLRLVGNGNNKVDACYIDNAVVAHLLAADCLLTTAQCAGKAYFISNDEPLVMAALINKILTAANLLPVTRTLNEQAAYYLGAIFEASYLLFNIQKEPLMTRFVAKQLACSHWFNLAAAKNDLGYQPNVTIDEGMKNLQRALAADPNDK